MNTQEQTANIGSIRNLIKTNYGATFSEHEIEDAIIYKSDGDPYAVDKWIVEASCKNNIKHAELVQCLWAIRDGFIVIEEPKSEAIYHNVEEQGQKVLAFVVFSFLGVSAILMAWIMWWHC